MEEKHLAIKRVMIFFSILLLGTGMMWAYSWNFVVASILIAFGLFLMAIPMILHFSNSWQNWLEKHDI